MSCIVKPKEFTEEQIQDCKKCKHVSGREVWCGLFGCWIDGRDLIIKPKYPPLIKQAGSFTKAAINQGLKGNPKRSDEEIAKIILICEGCDYYVKNKMRCTKCGCGMKTKIPWQTTRCYIGKW